MRSRPTSSPDAADPGDPGAHAAAVFARRLSKYFASGAVGFTHDGLIAVRDAAAIPLAERAAVNTAVADENRDRQAVYREIAMANDHADWEAQIRAAFAKQWIERARPGWYYQDATVPGSRNDDSTSSSRAAPCDGR